MAAEAEDSGPLAGVRIVDLTTVMMGPFATQILGDYGADVIKVEPPGGDVMRHAPPMRNPGMGAMYMQGNRNKRSVILDLKREPGKRALLRLCERADVFVHNVRPAAMKRLGLGPDEICARFPRVVYLSLFGYGETGPYSGRPAYDDLIQGAAGIPALYAQVSGEEPRYVPLAVADRIVGLNAVHAILAALLHRQRSGRGQAIEVPMFETLAQFVLGDHMGGRSFDPPLGPPGYGRLLQSDRRPYRTSDGYLCVLVYTDEHWRSFFEAIGRDAEFEANPLFNDFRTRASRYGEAYAYLAAELLQRSTAEWLDLLERHDIPRSSMHDLDALIDDPHLEAVGCPGVFHGTELFGSLEEIQDRALRIAAALREHWPERGRIAVASENRPEIVEVLFGIWAAGHAAVPVNAKLHAREIREILDDADVAALIASPKLAGELAGDEGASLPPLMVLGAATYEDLLAGEPAEPATVTPEDLAWLFYTSGTTGRSKGAMLSHRSLMAMAVAHLADLDDPDETTCLIHGAPMSHGSGLYILPYISRGAAQVVPASSIYDAAEVLDLCESHAGCAAFLAPTMVQRLRRAAEERGGPPRNLRSIIYGGGPMYIEELKKARVVFGNVFAQLYGQGEAPMTITGMSRRDYRDGSDETLGSVGWTRSGVEVRIASAEGETLPPSEIGEIVCRGDVLMSGYWRNPEATAQTVRNGWLFTGDIGSMDETGRLTLRDRSKDVVISGGTNIYPREVEEALLTHPDVEEVCVTGSPDPDWGEVVIAFVVLRQGVNRRATLTP